MLIIDSDAEIDVDFPKHYFRILVFSSGVTKPPLKLFQHVLSERLRLSA